MLLCLPQAWFLPFILNKQWRIRHFGHLHFKVRSASIATFRISLVISPHFVWLYQARIFHFSFLNASHKNLSFITWNLIILTYSRLPESNSTCERMNILFCFMYACKQHTKMSKQNQRGGNLFSRFTLPHTLNPFY